MKKSLFLLTAVLLFAAATPLFSQSASGGIVVTAEAKNANPTLIYTGGLSDQALSAKILSDLQICDWFTVLKSGNAAPVPFRNSRFHKKIQSCFRLTADRRKYHDNLNY